MRSIVLDTNVMSPVCVLDGADRFESYRWLAAAFSSTACRLPSNVEDFRGSERFGVKVIRPQEFLKLLGGKSSAH
jgi:hypothetical protein